MEEIVRKPCSHEERGRRFRELRLAKGLSQAQLASMTTDVSAGTISNLENGADISGIKFMRLCAALGVKNPDDILYE